MANRAASPSADPHHASGSTSRASTHAVASFRSPTYSPSATTTPTTIRPIDVGRTSSCAGPNRGPAAATSCGISSSPPHFGHRAEPGNAAWQVGQNSCMAAYSG